MPLNRIAGEHVEGLGDKFKIAPLRKWTDTHFWTEACADAQKKFANAGALAKVTFDEQHILVQEYQDLQRPLMKGGKAYKNALVFIFCREVYVSNWKTARRGVHELIHPVVFGINEQIKSEFIATGRWQARELVN